LLLLLILWCGGNSSSWCLWNGWIPLICSGSCRFLLGFQNSFFGIVICINIGYIFSFNFSLLNFGIIFRCLQLGIFILMSLYILGLFTFFSFFIFWFFIITLLSIFIINHIFIFLVFTFTFFIRWNVCLCFTRILFFQIFFRGIEFFFLLLVLSHFFNLLIFVAVWMMIKICWLFLCNFCNTTFLWIGLNFFSYRRGIFNLLKSVVILCCNEDWFNFIQSMTNGFF